MFAVSSLKSKGDATCIWSKNKGRSLTFWSLITRLLSAKADVNPKETNSSVARIT